MKKTDLLINASILSEKNTGLGVYTYQVLENIVPRLIEKGVTLDIICNNVNFLPSNCRKYAKIINYDGFISRLCRTSLQYKSKYRLAWSTTQHGGIFSRTKQIITIHDLIPLKYPYGRKHQYLYYKYILPILARKSEYIFTVSQNTKKDIAEYYKIPSYKICVVYESMYFNEMINQNENEYEKLKSKYAIDSQNYFLIIGIHFEYKNIHSVIEAYNRSDILKKYKIVIIGNDSGGYAKTLMDLIERYKLQDKILLLGFVNNNTKDSLIRNAISIVFPSLYEGFGIPILEAFNNNVPMICSNTSSLPEVGGDAALYFNPCNIEDIKEKMEEIITYPELRVKMVKKGKEQIKMFDWNDISEKMISHLFDAL